MKARALISLLILVAFFSNVWAVRDGILKLPGQAEKITSSFQNNLENAWCQPSDCNCIEIDGSTQCTCDSKWKEYCEPGCTHCICLMIWPPRCKCFDMKDYCPI